LVKVKSVGGLVEVVDVVDVAGMAVHGQIPQKKATTIIETLILPWQSCGLLVDDANPSKQEHSRLGGSSQLPLHHEFFPHCCSHV
jgi:hypothetical protein